MANEVIIYENTLPKVTTVGRFEVAEPWVHGSRNLKINTMIYVVKGTVYVSEEGIDYEISEASVFFFKGGCQQIGTREIQPGTHWYWVSFEGGRVADRMNSENTSEIILPKVIDCTDRDLIYKTLIRLQDVYISDLPYKTPLLDGGLHQLFYELLNINSRHNNEVPSKNIAPKVIRLLHQILEGSFSADYISKHMEMNYCYIGRLFKAETGVSINQYYMKLKVNQAINLLHTSELNISQISDRLNYPNPYYFSKVFKKITGMSPKAYKKHMY